MIEFAKDKVEKENLGQFIRFTLSPAEDLHSVRSESLDKVTMSFGIRNVVDRNIVLREIFNKLKAGCKLYILEFVPPVEEGLLATIARVFVHHVVPALGSLLSFGHSKEYKHLEKSIFEFPSPLVFIDEVKNAGFTNCVSNNIFFGVVYVFEATKA